MATMQDLQALSDQLGTLRNSLMTRMQAGGYKQGISAPNPAYDDPLKAIDQLNQSINQMRPAGTAGQTTIPDDVFTRLRGQVQSVLGGQSNAIQNALQTTPSDTLPINPQIAQQFQQGSQTTQDLTGIPPTQFVPPSATGGPLPPLPPFPPATAPTADTTGTQDRASIEAEGVRQQQQTLAAINQNFPQQQQYAAETFQRMLPQLAEDYNAHHLLNSTGYQQEAARQAAYLAQDLSSQRSNQIAQALTGAQGFQTAGLNRTFSLADFQRQAQLAQQLGAQAAPQVGSGKGAVGTTLGGIGALAPLVGAFGGPAGVMAGYGVNRATAGVNGRQSAGGK